MGYHKDRFLDRYCLKTNRLEIRVQTRRTCQISSQLPQVEVEVIKPDLRGQEDVLRFGKREHTLVSASVLVEQLQTHIHQ